MATLKDALQHSNMEEVMKILQSDHALPQRELNSALVTAISRDGPDDAIIPLLSHGAQITEGSICLAAARGDVVAFQAFLDYGWDINSLEFGQPALRLVVGHQDVVQWFFDHGADPNLRGSLNFSVLATAAHEPSTSVLQLLISHGAHLDPKALYNAMSPRRGGGIQVMRYLIEQGIDLNAPGVMVGHHYATPLHYAVRLRSMEKITILLEAGADQAIKNYGKTPAEFAKEKGFVDIFEILSK